MKWIPIYGEKTYHGFNERNRIVLDPLFWQALSKARGWDVQATSYVKYRFGADWANKAHDWFQRRMMNGDEQEFWEGLP